MAALQGLRESPVVHDLPPGRVDEDRLRLHLGDLIPPDHPLSLIGQLDIDAEDVGGFEKIIQ